MLDPKLSITCPKCRRKFQKPLSGLKNNASVPCPFCRNPGKVVGGGSDKAVSALKALDKSLRNLGFKKR